MSTDPIWCKTCEGWRLHVFNGLPVNCGRGNCPHPEVAPRAEARAEAPCPICLGAEGPCMRCGGTVEAAPAPAPPLPEMAAPLLDKLATVLAEHAPHAFALVWQLRQRLTELKAENAQLREQLGKRVSQLAEWALTFGHIAHALGHPEGEAPVGVIAQDVDKALHERDAVRQEAEALRVERDDLQRRNDEQAEHITAAYAEGGAWRYPHMCRDEHDEVGHRSDGELCPVCAARAEAEQARRERDEAQQGLAVAKCALAEESAYLRGTERQRDEAREQLSQARSALQAAQREAFMAGWYRRGAHKGAKMPPANVREAAYETWQSTISPDPRGAQEPT